MNSFCRLFGLLLLTQYLLTGPSLNNRCLAIGCIQEGDDFVEGIETPEEATARYRAECYETVNNTIKGRLRYYSHAIEIRNVDMDALMVAMEGETVDAIVEQHYAEGWAKPGGGGFSWRRTKEIVEPVLREKLAQIAGDQAVEMLDEDIQLIRQFERKSMISTVVTRMTLGLALNADQLDQLKTCLENEWESNEFKFESFSTADTLPRGQFPDESIRQILSPLQFEFWKKYRAELPARRRLFYAADDKDRILEFHVELQDAIELRIEVLQEQFDLGENQLRKLGVLAARYKESLAALRQEAYDNVAFYRENGRLSFEAKLLGRAHMAASVLLGSEGAWPGYVERVLADEDQEEYQQLTDKRNRVRDEAVAYRLARNFKRWGNLNGRQVSRIFEICLDNIPDDEKLIRGNRGFILVAFDNARTEFEEILNDRQMERITFSCDNIRALDEMLTEKQAALTADAEESKDSSEVPNDENEDGRDN